MKRTTTQRVSEVLQGTGAAWALEALCSNASAGKSTVRKALAELLAEGKVERIPGSDLRPVTWRWVGGLFPAVNDGKVMP